MRGPQRVLRIVVTFVLCFTLVGASESDGQSADLDPLTTNGWALVNSLHSAESSGLSPLSDEAASKLIRDLSVEPLEGERLEHRWVVRKGNSEGLAELFSNSPSTGRLVVSAVEVQGENVEDVDRLVAQFEIRQETMHVTIMSADGQMLDQRTAAMATNCDSDNSSCVAAAAAGAVTVGCAAGFALAPFTLGLSAVVGAAACTVAGAAGIAAGLACSAEPEPCPTPQMELTCDMDSCMAVVSYVLPLRRDNHSVVFEWESTPAPGYPNNAGDVVLRETIVGTGQSVSIFGVGTAYRYRISDFIWHSDIRCDTAMKVTATSSQTGPNSRWRGKSVPSDPNNAYCSDYGMTGELT